MADVKYMIVDLSFPHDATVQGPGLVQLALQGFLRRRYCTVQHSKFAMPSMACRAKQLHRRHHLPLINS